ncbi:MAG: hypothetical protein WAV91_02870 [Aquabacterium sp.]
MRSPERMPIQRTEVRTMLTAAPPGFQGSRHTTTVEAQPSDVIETRLWLEEHVWLYGVLKSDQNVGPTFRFPDLISACVSLIFSGPEAAKQIFGFLGSSLVARSPNTPRRREAMWRPQYDLLLELQRSPANRHPNPKFQLDHLTTTCVALCQLADETGVSVLQQARFNMAQRFRAEQATQTR